MIITQEENGIIEDYFYDKIKSGLDSLEAVSTDTKCETEVLKALCDVMKTRLSDFVKFIEKAEKDESKKSAKNKVLEMLNKNKGDM